MALAFVKIDIFYMYERMFMLKEFINVFIDF